MSIRGPGHLTSAASAVIAALLLAACAKQAEQPTAANASGGELEWARAALERNPQLEVLAADADKRVITVRQRTSGEVMAVQLDSIAAAPVALLKAPASAAATPTTAPATTTTTQTTTSEERVASTSAPPLEDSTGDAEPTQTEGNYTIQREGGQLRVSGPGVSIVSANAPDTRAQAQNSPATTPIVCEGSRFMHLDQRNLTVEGTAVIARNGCELHITNSRIRASGAALSVQNATVHVANSQLTGETASLEALGRARLFLRGSTFEGISRRDDNAELNDQGGNTWR